MKRKKIKYSTQFIEMPETDFNSVIPFDLVPEREFEKFQEMRIDYWFAKKLIDAGYNFIVRDKGGLYAASSDAWIFLDGWWIVDKTPQKIWKIEINVFQFLTGEETKMTSLAEFVKEKENEF